MAQNADVVQLKAPTLGAYETYIHDAGVETDRPMEERENFLWSESAAGRAQKIRSGEIVAEFWSGKAPVRAPDGLIHDWIGAVFVPAGTISRTLAVIQDYDNHKNVYTPEVLDSKLVSRDGDDFKIYLRLLKKKILTVVLDTDHDVRYGWSGGLTGFCRSRTTRICEVQHPGKPAEHALPADTGYGFLWRMQTEWRFEESGEGVWIECRAISLTRDIPKGLGWIIEPIVKNLPRESLVNTLNATRQAVAARS